MNVQTSKANWTRRTWKVPAMATARAPAQVSMPMPDRHGKAQVWVNAIIDTREWCLFEILLALQLFSFLQLQDLQYGSPENFNWLHVSSYFLATETTSAISKQTAEKISWLLLKEAATVTTMLLMHLEEKKFARKKKWWHAVSLCLAEKKKHLPFNERKNINDSLIIKLLLLKKNPS